MAPLVELTTLMIFIFSGAIVLAIVTCKIFSNLFECNNIVFVSFSDTHNWIIEPSASNKLYAISSAIFIFLSKIMLAALLISMNILNITASKCNDVRGYRFIINSLQIVGQTFYFFYMVSTLEYHLKQESFIKIMVPNKLIIITKLLTLFTILIFCASEWVWFSSGWSYEFHKVPWYLITGIVSLFAKLVLEIVLLCLYISGLNNVAHFWASKYWQEYKKYGETDKTHEIWIAMTRCTNIAIASCVATTIYILVSIVAEYGIYEYASNAVDTVINCIICILYANDDITYALGIYFMYPFGHSDYLRICGKCHLKMYSRCKDRHQKQVENQFQWKDGVVTYTAMYDDEQL